MQLEQTITSLLTSFQAQLLPYVIQAVITVSPIVLLFLLVRIFWELWVDYVQSSQFLNLKYTCLELKLPKETFKSPMAMEVFLTSIHNTSDGGLFNQFWKGETRPWYSLELISIEGQVKFVIWTEDRRKTNLIAVLYSQFPGIEVREIEDYTRSVHFDPTQIRIWAAEFGKYDDKKAQAELIRTYQEYNLPNDPKEEYKVDPMLPLLEFFGTAGPNTQLWLQIIIRAHKKTRKKGRLFAETDDWKDESQRLINDIMKRDPVTKVAGHKEEGTNVFAPVTLTKGEVEGVAALERSTYKKAFDVGIRCLYITKPDLFNTPWGVGGFVSSFNQFSAEGSNVVKINAKKWTPSLDAPWKDYKNFRRNLYGRIALMAYKRRSFFYPPFPGKISVMNTEELATIYHFPGSVSQLPTLERVPSKKAQAPTNLPV